ncbi:MULTISPECIES: large conductance mechanosensitive channel protein MscL [Actinomyces]|uniref:Mechanosensitive ion channel protein MscL n=1 Tax=Actinomyces oris TaxID=544580 RepID=A0A1Q8VKQ3_9ACTO|nr:large conductance mechanosensitive channel protein MscL [Actinomyces oris]OLO48659.1 mechanosensitive ion channel protein MscL [Actinomyces oris]
MIKGFKEFIAQGNALELAVAVIIGAAFKPIVDAITKVILDIIGQIVGQPNFDSIGQFKIFASSTEYIQPGTILTAVVNFFFIAIAVYFAIVMPMNKIKERMAKQKAEEEANEVTDVELLTEIRDLLSANAAKH